MNVAGKVLAMYVDGFRSMTVGRRLWAIILVKLLLFFGVLKIFFFPDLLATRYQNDEARAQAVRQALSKHNISSPLNE